MIFVYFGILFIFGAILGSFAVAQVWRLRAFELKIAKESGEKVSSKEWNRLKKLLSKTVRKDRSQCLNCEYSLRWFDLIPVFSWVSLGGKCRNCRQPIGKLEVLAEISLGVVFILVFSKLTFNFENLTWLDFSQNFLLIAILTLLTILFVYDAKWSLLPTKILWIFNFLALIYFLLGGFSVNYLVNMAISIAIFPLLYLVLTKISKGAWVGDGDWILALGLVLLLPNSPFFTILLLLFSNLAGIFTIILLGIFRKKKITRGVQIPFGPAMIFAYLLIVIFENPISQIVNLLAY